MGYKHYETTDNRITRTHHSSHYGEKGARAMTFQLNGVTVSHSVYDTVATDLLNLGIAHEYQDTDTISNIIFDEDEY